MSGRALTPTAKTGAGPTSGSPVKVGRPAGINPVWSRLAAPGSLPAGALQRSPLSDSVKDAYDNAKKEKFEALLARLGQTDVQSAQGDADVDKVIASLLAGRADDLWVAQSIRQGKLGESTGAFGPAVRGKPVPRPVEVFFFQGDSSQRALVIAGVHGDERQGIEVARMLISDLQKQQPYFTTIVVPALFPDLEASRLREKDAFKTNRNFPKADQSLADATKAGGGSPVDAEGRPIQKENIMLLEVMERFRPERVISIHGTWRGGAPGVFFDPRALRASEAQQARQDGASMADFYSPHGWDKSFYDPARQDLEERFTSEALQARRQQAYDTDADLSRRAAVSIDQATAQVANRDKRKFGNREDDPVDPKTKKSKVPAAETAARAAHPSVAGNVGKSGKIDYFAWSGSGTGGISLGGYAPPRGMSVFTVEPPMNSNTDDYATKKWGRGGADAVSVADRKIELQAYADAVRTVLLGK